MSENIQVIGQIGNYYGGLAVKQEGEKFFWAIENWDGYEWQEIPRSLYDALISFEQEKH
ncbi:hypothetical protein [Pseudomonas sp. p1(2021b)]|uniref:hypothetical protein n=1 Tax=Pseudomonas sp. p1(2021b) TaxID=2874628 RepID=UPI003D27BE04